MEAQRESKMPNWLVVLANKLTNMVKVAGVICRSVGAGGISATPRPATIHSEPLVPTKMPITYCGRRVTGETQRKLLEMLVSSPSATPQELDEHLGLRNSPDVVMRMARRNGWNFIKHEYWAANAVTSRKRRHVIYLLSDQEREVARRILGLLAGRDIRTVGGC